MRKSSLSLVIGSLAATFCVLATACSTTPGDTSIRQVTPPPVGGIDGATAVLPVGMALSFSVTTDSAGSDFFTVSVDDPSRAILLLTTDPATYVLVGKAAGRTVLHARASNANETTMTVTVPQQMPQP